ncbi:hypothetical protein BDZ89DRAFT_1134455 [Hymenopellis radicata]|nr:hypothetical protein BDZ89DRAFT_1134455 [Hymenopellis radicata]
MIASRFAFRVHLPIALSVIFILVRYRPARLIQDLGCVFRMTSTLTRYTWTLIHIARGTASIERVLICQEGALAGRRQGGGSCMFVHSSSQIIAFATDFKSHRWHLIVDRRLLSDFRYLWLVSPARCRVIANAEEELDGIPMSQLSNHRIAKIYGAHLPDDFDIDALHRLSPC